ncbi:MAG: cell wall-binding repeat-containing protein [Tissierella sp.]|uniref:cell wall-binding repeat-containing protein n=1 Tax=Tissierella sp. TaxID=41274 RepID=UPI003F954B60
MKRISKFISIILLLAIMLPGIVDAGNVNSSESQALNEVEEKSEIDKLSETDQLELEETNLESETETNEETQIVEKKEEMEAETATEIEEKEKEEVKTNEDEPQKMNLQTFSESNKYIERIEGKNRVETSIKVSQAAYKGEKVDTVLLAGYDGQADALTATFVAGQEDAPLLLTYKNKIDTKLLAELERLNPERIVILGGENVIYKTVENGLRSKGYEVKRIEGSSRIETAINVASDYYDYKSGLSKASKAFVIEYSSLVDALAIGPVAARDGIPILIMKKDSVPSRVADFLKEKDIEEVTIVGGESRISEKGKNELENTVGVGKVKRISGNNRIQTSITICDTYFANRDSTVVANGHRYTDALIGGYFAAKKNAPIILTNEGQVTEGALHCIGKVDVKSYILGGDSVISDSMFKSIKNKLEPKPNPEPKPEPGQRKKYSTTADLNMRSSIGVKPNNKILTIPRGKEVKFVSDHGSWSKIKYNSKEGYVSNKYIKVEIVPEDEPVEKPKPDEPKPGQAMVCLDYGHGGSDPGALLRNSKDTVIRREKDDTIKMGKLVAKDLRRHGVIVDETRTTDKYVSLSNRAAFSNKKDYNYFVSFHRNAFSKPSAEGVEVWTTKLSSWKSKALAKSIQKSLVGVGYTERKGEKFANFTVLAKTKAPAVLIELGFISNEGDNHIYDTKEDQIVKAVTSAILGQLGMEYKN